MKYKTCCFIAPYSTRLSDDDIKKLELILNDIVINANVRTFLFGFQTDIDFVCYRILKNIKDKYPNIKLIYLQKGFKNLIKKNYKDKFKLYDKSYYPKKDACTGELSPFKRHEIYIDNSDYCIFYQRKDDKDIKVFDSSNLPLDIDKTIAYNYAMQKKKEIINI